MMSHPHGDRDTAQGHDSPPEAHLLFEQPDRYTCAVPDARRDSAEQRMLDRGNKVAPPFGAVAKEVVALEAERRAVRDNAGGRVSRVGNTADGDNDKAADRDR